MRPIESVQPGTGSSKAADIIEGLRKNRGIFAVLF